MVQDRHLRLPWHYRVESSKKEVFSLVDRRLLHIHVYSNPFDT